MASIPSAPERAGWLGCHRPSPSPPPPALPPPPQPLPHRLAPHRVVALAPAQPERDAGAVVGAGHVQLGGQAPPASGPAPGRVVRRFWGGVLMSPHHRRIDEEFLESFILAAVGPLPQSLPEGARFPVAETLVNGIPVPERLGQVAPGGADARLVEVNIRSLRTGVRPVACLSLRSIGSTSAQTASEMRRRHAVVVLRKRLLVENQSISLDIRQHDLDSR